MRGGARDRLARSITTCVPAMASLRPSPVMVLTSVSGGAATTSWHAGAGWGWSSSRSCRCRRSRRFSLRTSSFVARNLGFVMAASCHQRVWSTARETERLHFDAHLAGARLRTWRFTGSNRRPVLFTYIAFTRAMCRSARRGLRAWPRSPSRSVNQTPSRL